MNGGICEKCGKALEYVAFGRVGETLCRDCWEATRPADTVRTPRWYKQQIDELEREMAERKEQFQIAEDKHTRMLREYAKYYDMFGVRRDEMLKEGKK